MTCRSYGFFEIIRTIEERIPLLGGLCCYAWLFLLTIFAAQEYHLFLSLDSATGGFLKSI